MTEYKDIQPYAEGLPGFDRDRFEALVTREPEKYPEHAVLAASLARWRDALRDDDEMLRSMDPRDLRTYRNALQAVEDFLFLGEFLPRGDLRLAEPTEKPRPSAEDRARILEQFKAGEGRRSAD